MQTDNKLQAPKARRPAGTGLSTDIVSNIPIKAPNVPLSPISDDEDLDNLMQDVSKDLKQSAIKPAKKRFFDFKKKPKPSKPAPVSLPAPDARPVQAKPQPPAKTKTPAQPASVPIFIITVTIIVTVILIAAAYYAYK